MNTKVTGDLGETVSARFLERHGFVIVARNYRKKWGELDIVAVKDGIFHFFEVKSTNVSHFNGFRDNGGSRNAYRPEENVHHAKAARLRRTIQTFLAEAGKGPDTEFAVHVLAVYMEVERRKAHISWIKNVVL